jgi:hypothetical protein
MGHGAVSGNIRYQIYLGDDPSSDGALHLEQLCFTLRHVSRRNDEGSRRSSKRAWNGKGRSVNDGDWRSRAVDEVELPWV